LLTPNCKTIVVVLLNYYSKIKQPPSSPKIARYAYSTVDYHSIIKEKLSKFRKNIVDLPV
jgi:epoxyqueuosine reductase